MIERKVFARLVSHIMAWSRGRLEEQVTWNNRMSVWLYLCKYLCFGRSCLLKYIDKKGFLCSDVHRDWKGEGGILTPLYNFLDVHILLNENVTLWYLCIRFGSTLLNTVILLFSNFSYKSTSSIPQPLILVLYPPAVMISFL